jgi:hypothetical protein
MLCKRSTTQVCDHRSVCEVLSLSKLCTFAHCAKSFVVFQLFHIPLKFDTPKNLKSFLKLSSEMASEEDCDHEMIHPANLKVV